jgi:hypothetical protein
MRCPAYLDGAWGFGLDVRRAVAMRLLELPGRRNL